MKRSIKNIPKYGALILVSLIVGAPTLYALIVSTQIMARVIQYPPNIIPQQFLFQNMHRAWTEADMGILLMNSSIVAISVAVGKISLALLAAFGLTYFHFRSKNLFFVLILITHMLPLAIRIVPTYSIMASLGWVDTYYALIFPFFASATGVLLFRQFFLAVPLSLVDAARVDGVTPLGYLFRVLIPLSRNTIAALFVVEFIWAWNQYLWPLIITDSSDMRVVQIGIKMLIPADAIPEWNVVMAAVVIALLPPLIVLMVLRKQFVEGFALQQMK